MQRLSDFFSKKDEYVLSGEELRFIKLNIENFATKDSSEFVAVVHKTYKEKNPNSTAESGVASELVVVSNNVSMPPVLPDAESPGMKMPHLLKDIQRSGLVIELLENPKDIDVLEALEELLTSTFGQQGPHSFKYLLLCNLFGLEKDVDRNLACARVDSYAQAVKEENKNRASKRYATAQRKFDGTKVDATRFDEVCTGTLGVLKNSLKNKARKLEVDAIVASLKLGRITQAAALYQCLTLMLGKKTAHSFKYRLLKSLYDLGREEDKHASKWVDCFVDIATRKLADLKVDRESRVKKMLDERPAELLSQNIKSFLADRKNPQVTASAEAVQQASIAPVFSFFHGLYRDAKEWSREKLISANLSDGTISPYLELKRLLLLSVGEKGLHSFKYKLLEYIFGRTSQREARYSTFIELEDAKSASEMIDCFIAALGEKLLLPSPSAQELDNMQVPSQGEQDLEGNDSDNEGYLGGDEGSDKESVEAVLQAYHEERKVKPPQ